MSWLGSAITGATNLLGTHLTNKSNAKINQKQMDFQANMSSSAYQRATADMRKAGLNPMLAYSQGGASTPQGSSYEHQNELSAGISSAMEVRRQNADIKAINEAVNTQKSQQALYKAQEKQALQQAKLNSASAKQVSTQEKLAQTKLPAAKTKQKIDSSKSGKALNTIKEYGKKIPLFGRFF